MQNSVDGELPDSPDQGDYKSVHDQLADHQEVCLSHVFIRASDDLAHAHVFDGAPGLFGTPNHDMAHFRWQQTPFTCDVMAQLQIFDCITGKQISETLGAVDAAAHGFLTSEGTLPEHMSKLLELYGVPCHENSNGTFLDVIKELRDGHKVIVGVHSDGLWRSNDHLEAFANRAADHAIWLTGVDASDPHHIKVIVNDSGKPDGGGNVYDLHDLKDVLNCPGFHYVATNAGSPHLPDQPQGYDERSHVFPDLDQFLRDHGVAVAITGGACIAASAGLLVARLSARRSEGAGEEFHMPSRPAIGRSPPPLLLPDMTREARDRVLRDI